MGEAKPELLETMKEYSVAKYAKTREEVEAEIKERWRNVEGDATAPQSSVSLSGANPPVEGRAPDPAQPQNNSASSVASPSSSAPVLNLVRLMWRGRKASWRPGRRKKRR